MRGMRDSAGRGFIALVTVLSICSGALAAEETSGTISGVTSDDFGNATPQVEISVKNSASGAQYRTTSGAQGEYTVAGLPPGVYEISVTVHGSQLFARKNVQVEAGKTVRMDARLRDATINAIGDNPFAAAAMEHRPIPTGPTPRAADGHPDLSGVWATMRQLGASDTELLPWAQAEMKRPDRVSPNAFCLPQGPRLGGANPFKFIQAPKTIIVLSEDIFTYRQIHMDGRGHPKDADPTWMGHSIGHWEGDTLVVDTANFNDKSWMPFGRPHTEQLRVVERIRRPDEGHLEYEFTVDDPATFTRPWTVKYATTLLAGDEIGEYICTENEQDITHYKNN
jgi:hypothetical protein